MTITPLPGLVTGATAPATPKPASAPTTQQSGAAADTGPIFDVPYTFDAQDGPIFPGNTLKQSADSLSQLFSASQAADQSLRKQANLVVQLHQLASQATNDTLSSASRQQLNVQFQQLVSQLDNLVGTSQFTGRNLLDGTFTQQLPQATGTGVPDQVALPDNSQTTLSLPNLSSTAIFGNPQPDLSSAQSAQQAAVALAAASQVVAQAQQNVTGFTQTLNYVAAGLESALYNQNASVSSFSDSDFPAANFSQGSSAGALASLLAGNGSSAASATGIIPASVLDLIN